MKVKVIRKFTDKYTMKRIAKDSEIEISKERFGELTTGPRGIFVEEIVEGPKIYKCTKCDFETTNKGEVGSHYKTMHPKPKE
jgi:hypothetical protein